jgi:hypothetical protein
VTDSSEQGNKLSGSVKGGEFLDHLRDCQLLQKKLAAWNKFHKFRYKDA